MEVNFDNLRLGLQEELNGLIDFLNRNYDEQAESIDLDSFKLAHLRRHLARLQQSTLTIMCVYSEDVTNLADRCAPKEIEFGD